MIEHVEFFRGTGLTAQIGRFRSAELQPCSEFVGGDPRVEFAVALPRGGMFAIEHPQKITAVLFTSPTKAQLISQIVDLQSQITDLNAEKADIQAANDTNAQQKAELESLMAELDAKIAEAQSYMSQGVLAAQAAERAQLATDLAEYTAQKAAVEAQIENLDPESETYGADYSLLSDVLQSIENNKQAALDRLDKLNNDYESAKLNDPLMEAYIDIFNGQKAGLQKQIDDINSNINSNNARIDENDDEINGKQNEINDKQNEIDGKQNQINDLQSQIDAMNNM